jgi:hypothetical protein
MGWEAVGYPGEGEGAAEKRGYRRRRTQKPPAGVPVPHEPSGGREATPPRAAVPQEHGLPNEHAQTYAILG